ncbi:hypothetical protein BHF71_05535 [Vulcanibacillus modesticaldus]|uniref:Uncharacterized protein n=1 Tax=Vulcanibacillus modesticaldus TaxID=337097 RepID=A0A1D2YX59_9BACI|nr:hypothetical protein [Vulcanibacillus modesticaldus]OEG00250.1 hypothetical protein BHF71_05535 [Vulcanibacillus modesticaldus]
MDIIKQEVPSYLTVLLRKSGIVKTVETIVFLFVLLILWFELGYDNPNFKIGALISATLTLGLSPIVYKLIVKPKYSLTETHLVINKLNEELLIPIAKIKRSYDMRFFYIIDGKKTALTVSDDFIRELDLQIEKIKKMSR